MTTSLFHYCSTETFLSIITNKSIRLSDISKSNDSKETKWLLEYLEEEIVQQYKKRPFFKGQLIFGLNEIDALKLIVMSIKERMLKRNEELLFVSCFSENGDKLSQWRGYADDGYGLAIGFNLKTLKKIVESVENLSLLKVIYPDIVNSFSTEISEYSKVVIDSINNAIAMGNLERLFSKDYYALDIFHELSSRDFIRKSIKFKNPAFEEEVEWRLIFDDEVDKYSEWENWYDSVENKTLLDGQLSKLFSKGLQFKAYRNKIVSFFDLIFKGYENTIINEINIGPKSDIQESDIYQLLRYYGYDADEIKINKSVSTYR